MAMNMDAMLRIKADVQGENNIRRLGNSMQGLQGQVKNAAAGFSNLKGAVAGFGAAIAGSAIVGGLGMIVKKSIDAGDELFNLQAKTGIAANALIGLGNAAKLADVDQETLGKGLTKLSINLVKAAEGNDDLARKFAALGVSVKGADGQVVSADVALKQIADRFADMPDGAQKAAAAVALFGKSGADLIPLLNEGAAAMEEFTYKVSDDFAARSDLFNDTITELGIKAQGFGMELTDALLPALQSILEVFGDLFDTDQDWTVLFEVIKGGLRVIATALYATIKLVDQFLKAWGATFDALNKARQGDFAGAGRALYQGLTQGIEQAKRDFQQIQKIWTDAPSPGTGLRRGGTAMGLDTTDADKRAASEAAKAEAAAKRAAAEAERLAERRASLAERAIELQRQLTRSVEDSNIAYEQVGATPVDELLLRRNEAITENNRTVDDFTLSVVNLVKEINDAGGQIDVKPFEELINRLSQANVDLAEKDLLQGLKDLLPSLDEYDAKIKEVQLGKKELTELEKLNAQVNLLQLDILAATNPALAEHIRLLRERAEALDKATAEQKKQNESFGTKFKQQLQDAYKSATDLGTQLGGVVVGGIDSLTNAIVEMASTGKAAFKELAASALKELGAIFIKYALFKALFGIFPGLSIGMAATGGATGPNSSAPLKKFATGGVMSNNVVPMRRYAAGGIARDPQMAIYGERGPEAFVPLPDGRSIPVKMKQRNDALNRYRPMGGTGTMAADGEMAPAGGGGAVGRNNAIDVRYTVERINNVEYVTADQFQKGMKQAAAQGATLGERAALRRLQYSPGGRKGVGI
jgi:hypothetical protein